MSDGLLIVVGSFDEMKNYVIRMNDRASEMNETRTKVVNSLFNLQDNLECDKEFKNALIQLGEAIDGNTKRVNEVFQEISSFINKQIAQYNEANKETEGELGGTYSNIENINPNA